jgi:hypothetical protein
MKAIDPETFGHCVVQRSLSENKVHGSRCSSGSESPGPESGQLRHRRAGMAL